MGGRESAQATPVHAGLEHVRARMAAAAEVANRAPSAVSLIAVSKSFAAAEILPVLEAGQRVFGENRVQEAAEKWPALRQRYPSLELHLIGPLQTNKVRDAVALFEVIHTLDRLKLAKAIRAECDGQGKRPKLLVQINTGEEPQKSGVAPAEADTFIAQCRDEVGLSIAGLMCIPPADEEPALHFALLAKIARRNGLAGLSMGMSADFETAIALDATFIRVGSAIFGERQLTPP
ncbi:MAG: YggS family pyridoxal phosphate-dependent enzyme [Pseudomonadota bacterium]|nr:YggS family pyridoxal phosphate-dependent enzyme [Pseudomonadota bacterium]